MNIRHSLRASALLAMALCTAASQAAPQQKAVPESATPRPASTALRPAVLAPLPIALPPNVKIEFEVDGGQDDVLGMAKAFLGGLEETNAPRPGARPASGTWLQLLGDKQFSAILKDVRHLHLVVYRLPEASGGMTIQGGTMEGGVTLAPSTRRGAEASFDAIAFHAKPLLAAGGRRNLQANVGRSRVQMFDFAPSPGAASPTSSRGFGLIVQSASRIIVARSHGYPNMAALGRLIHFNSAS